MLFDESRCLALRAARRNRRDRRAIAPQRETIIPCARTAFKNNIARGQNRAGRGRRRFVYAGRWRKKVEQRLLAVVHADGGRSKIQAPRSRERSKLNRS